MVKLNKIYTKTGDSGETGLGDGSRISKASLRVTAIGAVDEANSAIGVARLEAQAQMDTMLARIQNDLFDLGADLCAPEDGRKAEGRLRMSAAQVERLEREIDAMNEDLPPLRSFVLPGGTRLNADLHVARTVSRRAERLVVALAREEDVPSEAVQYLNRLSDAIFVWSRWANFVLHVPELLWDPNQAASARSGGENIL